MPRTRFYDQRTHTVGTDDFNLEDFGEGEGVIAFEPEGDLNTVTRGLDRNAQSFGSPRPGTLTVQLKPTSPSIPRMIEMAEGANGRELVDWSVTTGVEDVLDLNECSVEDAGFSTGGPTMEVRNFIIRASTYTYSET